jgi:serine/threonine-protein kinase
MNPDRRRRMDEDDTHTAGATPVAEATAAPLTWGDLRLIGEIGRGGFGRVFRARDEVLARDVALKIIRPRDAGRIDAVLREGQMLARVRHRNVVTVHSARRLGGEVGLTMELIDGRSLADLLRQGGPMGPEEAAFIGITLCQALAAVHGAGLLHRDVKANNVMRESGGRIVLMDFGAGRDSDQGPLFAAEITGTPRYLAPELFEGRAASPASDLYSLGVLLFHLVTDAYPVNGRDLDEIARAHRTGDRRRLADSRPDLPDGFVRVVERALAPTPELRYQSAGAMQVELGEAVPAAGRAEPSAPPGRSPLVWWAGAAAVVVLGIGVLGTLMSLQYDATLGLRAAGFATESPASWWIWGLRSLVSPVAYGAFILLVASAARGLWGLSQRTVPPLRHVSSLGTTVASKAAARFTGGSDAARARWLIVAQAASLGAVIWWFSDLIYAFITLEIADGDASLFALLDQEGAGARHLYSYRFFLTLIVCVSVLAWYRRLRRPWTRRAIPPADRAVGVVLIVVALLLLEIPYRVFYQNDAPVLDVAGLRCYEIGDTDSHRLAFCPETAPSRIRPLDRNQPGVRVTGTGSIFSQPARRPTPEGR